MKKRQLQTHMEIEGRTQRKNITKIIAKELMKVMKKHIGIDANIGQKQLFKKIFKKPLEDTLNDYLRWDFTKKAMHYCRTHTYCFISSYDGGDQWYYFVVEDKDDAQTYCDVLDKSINSMKKMKKKAYKAAKEKWYKKDWLISGNPNLKQLK